MQKNEVGPFPHATYKICYLKLDNGFLGLRCDTKNNKRKNRQMRLSKFKTFMLQRAPSRKSKENPQNGENFFFANH